MRPDLTRTRDSRTLMKVALGEEKADLVVINARLANVYTGEWVDNLSIAVKGEWIAYVGADATHCIDADTRVIDAAGKPVVPGLIDGHTHLVWLFSVAEFLPFAMAGGTTTVVTETLEAYPVAGLEGVADFLDSLKDQPIKIFATAPAMVSISSKTMGMPPGDLNALLDREEILGLGESYWQGVLQQPEKMLPAMDRVLSAGKCLEGHSAGASEKKLNAYLCTGITSCHEPITDEEVLTRLRLGLHVMVREGSIRRDLETIARIRHRGIDCRRLILATDGVDPVDLMEKGNLEYVLQKAMDYGFEPITAIQMATLNVAEHFGLDPVLGGIAPGRFADVLIWPDERTATPKMVISNGRIVAENGTACISPRPHEFRDKSRATIRLKGDLFPEDFALRPATDRPEIGVRVIDMVTDLVTREVHLTLPAVDGRVRTDPAADIIKVAAIDRTHTPGKTFTGLLRGFGLRRGAMAASCAWDTSDIIVAGADEKDMAACVNRIRSLQGGMVVCADGHVIAEIPLPVFGIVSMAPMAELAAKSKELTAAAAGLGCEFPNPFLSLITLTGAAIPFFRICEEGLVDFRRPGAQGLWLEKKN
ncbi:MAG: adenine deaminase [Desulfobacterales bacterium]|nr:adenine deaminase [Desulfobacterales bacterium]